MTDMVTCQGDSGSPVTTGATWVGIASGFWPSNPNTDGVCGNSQSRMFFSKIFYLNNYYNLEMLDYDP